MGKFLVESNATESGKSKESSFPHQDNAKVRGKDEWHFESYYGSELPSNIIFPNQLNKFLKDQIHNLSLENGSLRRSLEEMQDELNSAKRKSSKSSLSLAGRASDTVTSKIVELSKKLRERNAEFEAMKTRAKDAEAKLRQFENNPIEQKLVTVPPSEEEISEKDKQIKILTEKLQTANAKLCDSRNQCQALKQDLKLAQKVIENEIGEKVAIQDLAKENGNWRGRAQQIISLQNKVQHLQEQLSTTTISDSPAANVLRQMEKDRRASYEETSKQLNQKTIQMEEMRKKLEASKARNKVLENEIVQMKTKLTSLMDKGMRDDQLLASLTNQINLFEDREKAQVQCFSKMQDNINKLQDDINIEKQKNEQLQKALADRDTKNRRLQEQVEELKKIKNLHVESSAETDPNKSEENQDLIMDKRALTIVDSERMRLLELLAIVNRRLDESRKEKMEADAQIRKEKFKNAKLETKVARLELERVGVLKTGRGSYSQNGFKPVDFLLENADISARQQIEYLEEECLALKTRIETLQMEKEDDLKVFAALTDARNKYEKKMADSSITRKPTSPKDKKNLSKLTNRKTKHNQTKIRKFSPPGCSATGQSSFSSEESITQ